MMNRRSVLKTLATLISGAVVAPLARMGGGKKPAAPLATDVRGSLATAVPEPEFYSQMAVYSVGPSMPDTRTQIDSLPKGEPPILNMLEQVQGQSEEHCRVLERAIRGHFREMPRRCVGEEFREDSEDSFPARGWAALLKTTVVTPLGIGFITGPPEPEKILLIFTFDNDIPRRYVGEYPTGWMEFKAGNPFDRTYLTERIPSHA